MSLIQKRGLGDQIVDLLRDRIISGELCAEAPIRQDALASELGVSKIPLREAFAKLEQDGLVGSHMNRGFFVRALSAEEAYDVFDLRLKIEPGAVAAGSAAVRPADRDHARRALLALNQATAAGSPGAGALNRAFHMALIRPAGRPVTTQTVERLQFIAERYVVRHLEPTGRTGRAAAEHEALLEAWAAGRTEDAARLTTDHIATTLKDLRAEFDKDRGGTPA